MYSSLHKLDLAAAYPGRPFKLLVQTDHRRALDIADDAALSVVFAIARCLVARAIGDDDAKLQPYRVVYKLADPPAFLAYAITAAGAHVGEPADDAPAPRVQPDVLVALIDDACARIADDARRRDAIELSSAGLAAWEQRLAVADPEHDQHAYYAAVVTLGALAAAVVRARLPQVAWRYAPGDIVPFALGGPNADDARVLPVFALARRYADGIRAGARDPSDAPSLLVGLLTGDTKQIVIE